MTQRLAAPPPGWTARADVVVVGSGIAGLTAALHARRGGRVLLVTKARLDEGSTRWAQGGIAAALAPGDSPAAHQRDTLVAGAGLCDEAAVAVLVREGPARVAELVELGARFDRDPDGALALTREGGHLHNRIAHAGGDATGMEVQRALLAAIRDASDVEVIEHALVLDLLRTPEGRACGVTLHVLGEGSRDGVGAALGGAVVLATGGMGQVYASTTNPPVSTGDGVALAVRAGAQVADLEFVQFHPTALWRGPDAVGQQPLVSEAMRGEGARLVDAAGRRVMAGLHPLEDLAPRDVVTKAMALRMAAAGVDHLFLDARALGAERLLQRFPTIVGTCREHGIDPVRELIPVAPSAHYASGGVRTDLLGRTSVPGLYACGEVACTGVHGANRLASNSLLEGLVFAARIGADIAANSPACPAARADDSGLHPSDAAGLDPRDAATGARGLLPGRVPPFDAAVRGELARAMTDGAGVLRSADSLARTTKILDGLDRIGSPGTDSWEATNMQLVARAIVAGAALREETRGCHWREDFPASDERWRARVVTVLDADGALRSHLAPLAAAGSGSWA